MIATDADALLEWHGDESDHVDLIIENRSAAPATGAVWPDGAHSQIYTNPDGPDAYVELELLGPLYDLAPGQSASLTSRYELRRRDLPEAAAAGDGTPRSRARAGNDASRSERPPGQSGTGSDLGAAFGAGARRPGTFAAGGRAGACFVSLCLCGSGCAALRNANERSTPRSSGTTTVSER